MNAIGFASAALQFGLQSILVKPTRGIYGPQTPDGKVLPDIKVPQAVVEERHMDQLEITDHPIELGASITDHAFKRPSEVVLHMGWSNSPSAGSSLINAAVGLGAAANSTIRAVAGVVNFATGIQSALNGANTSQIKDIYATLLRLQTTRAIFVIYTGKRVYTNMVCKTLSVETDAKTENSLMVTMVCHEVLLVNTQVVKLPKAVQKPATVADTATPANSGTVRPKEK